MKRPVKFNLEGLIVAKGVKSLPDNIIFRIPFAEALYYDHARAITQCCQPSQYFLLSAV